MRLNREDAKEYIKEQYTEDYLRQTGIPTTRNIKCLVMGAGHTGNEDKRESMGYDRTAHQMHCFACDARLDIFDLIGMDYGLNNFLDQFNKACEMYNIEIIPDATGNYKPSKPKKREEEPEEPEADLTEYFNRCNKALRDPDNAGLSYLEGRGLSIGTCNRFNVGFDKTYKKSETATPVPVIIIPTGTGRFTPRSIEPNTDSRFLVKKGSHRNLFNAEALNTAEKPVFITESEIDALSIIEAGGEACGLGGTSMAGKFVKALEKRKGKQLLILCLDNDKYGREASQKIINGIAQGIEEKRIRPENAVYIVLNPYGAWKDANEILQANRQTFIKDIAEISENPTRWKYEHENSVAGFIQAFADGVRESANTPVISTGFKNLDEAMDGGIYPGLIIMGAVSSLGKTTLALNLCDNMAMQGHDVLFFSLEMSKFELVAKSISRMTYMNVLNSGGRWSSHDAKTTRGIMDGRRYSNYSDAERELIKESVSDYREFAEKRIYIVEAMGDVGAEEIRRTAEKHIETTGRTPIIFVDYLQIMKPYDAHYSDKMNVDKSVLELKRVSRDLKTPVIAVSSLNRASYTGTISETAFKESGSVEYTSDTLIGLQFSSEPKDAKDLRAEKAKNPRELELVIMKNRNAPIPAEPTAFNFYPLFNHFEEA